MATRRRWGAPERSASISAISRCPAASTSASAWDSDYEKHHHGTHRHPGPVGRMQQLPRRQYESQRPAVGVGESLSAADATLDGDVPAVRWSFRRALRPGMVFDVEAGLPGDAV